MAETTGRAFLQGKETACARAGMKMRPGKTVHEFDCLVHIGQNRHMKAQGTKADPESAASAVRLRRRPGHVATFRNSRGEALEPSSVSASQAKSEFGRVLEIAIQGGAVVITKHDAPRAVLISVENFNALSGAAQTKLDTLSREFDALLARMQTSKARRGMKAAFAASGKRLGKAAVAATRSRG
jgi:antitoxin Phd